MSELLPMGPARYYRHSGHVPPKALVGGLGAAVGLGLLAGAAYGYAGLYAHLIPLGKLTFVLIILGTMGLGKLLGAVTAKLLCKWDARSNAAAVGLSTVASLAALYGAWVMYVFALMQYVKQDVPVWYIAQPAHLWDIVQSLNEAGVWTVGNSTPNGLILALCWLAEATVVIGMARGSALKGMNQRVFCEHCQKWGSEKRELMQVADSVALKKDLQEGRLDSLCAAPAKSAGAYVWCDVSLEGCADCDNLQTLTVERWVLTLDQRNRSSSKRTCLLKRLMLTGEQTLAVIQAAAALKAPVETPVEETKDDNPTPGATAPAAEGDDAGEAGKGAGGGDEGRE